MSRARPLASEIRTALVDAIKVADPVAKVHHERRNARDAADFEKLYMVGNQTHAWEIEYDPTQPAAREDRAGDLYWRIHRFLAHLWFGPYHDKSEAGVDAADAMHEVADALTADQTIFRLPEVTERTVLAPSFQVEHFHFALHYHGVLPVEITAPQFAPA